MPTPSSLTSGAASKTRTHNSALMESNGNREPGDSAANDRNAAAGPGIHARFKTSGFATLVG